MMKRFLVKVLVSAAAVWAADYLLDGFSVLGGAYSYLLAGLVLCTLNTFVRPAVKLLALPLMLVTFGLFTVIINVGILWLTDYWLAAVSISGLAALAMATLIISVINMFLHHTYE